MFQPISDVYAFVRKGIPSLALRGGLRRAAPGLRACSASIWSRRLGSSDFVYYVGETIVNADQRLHWSVEGRRRYMATVMTSAP